MDPASRMMVVVTVAVGERNRRWGCDDGGGEAAGRCDWQWICDGVVESRPDVEEEEEEEEAFYHRGR